MDSRPPSTPGKVPGNGRPAEAPWDGDSPRRYGTAVPHGDGTTAQVFKAFDQHLDRYVALKYLRWSDPQLAERMFREAKAQAKIQHDGVCQVYDTGWLSGRPFIAMQWVDGVDLLSAAQPLSLRGKLELMVQVADAVAAGHRAGIIHRDLKPDNILVERHEDGRLHPVVVDFGLVFEPDDPSRRMTEVGLPLGTPGYMAPEQAAGDGEAIGPRTDVYGLGATLYQMLTGSMTFRAKSTAEMLMKTIEAEPTPPRRRVRDLPKEVENIVLKCLHKKPAERYATADELASDLRRFLDGEAVQAKPTTAPRLWRALFQNRFGLPAVLALSAAFLLLGAVTWQSLTQRMNLEQHYLQLANDLAWSFRAEMMSARHDVTPARDKVRETIQQLEEDQQASRGRARAAIEYALGRAHATLQKDLLARQHLESAWKGGFRRPEVGYALGLVIGRLYDRELQSLNAVRESQLRGELEQRFLQPAAYYLDTGRDVGTVAVDYVGALIDLYEERYDDSLAKLQKVTAEKPWFYEAVQARGLVLERIGMEHYRESALQQAEDNYHSATDAYRSAIASAPSDPAAYGLLCHLGCVLLDLRLATSQPVDGDDVEQMLLPCEQALEVDPEAANVNREGARAYAWTSSYWVSATWNEDRAKAARDRAEQLALRAIELDPKDSANYEALADVQMKSGRLRARLETEGDPRESFEAARSSLEKAVELSADEDYLAAKMASNWAAIAVEAYVRGLPAKQLVDKAVRTFETAVERSPKSFLVRCELGDFYRQASYTAWREQDAELHRIYLARATSAFESCLELNPQYLSGILGLSSVRLGDATLHCIGDQPDAIESYRQAIEPMQTAARRGNNDAALSALEGWTSLARCQVHRGEEARSSLIHARSYIDQLASGMSTPEFERTRLNLATAEIQQLLLAGPLHVQHLAELADLGSEDAILLNEFGSVSLDYQLWAVAAKLRLGEDISQPVTSATERMAELLAQNGPQLLEQSEYRLVHSMLTWFQQIVRSGSLTRQQLESGKAALQDVLAKDPRYRIPNGRWQSYLEQLGSAEDLPATVHTGQLGGL